MTYIVGIRKPEHNFLAIISDVMVTKVYGDGRVHKENTALKTGRLFNGCIYGLAGDATAGIEFLVTFKKSINFNDEINNNLGHLQNFVLSDSWDSGRGFKILFGIRNPKPQFYLLDSISREIRILPNLVYTMGSGKSILDEIVFAAYDYSNSHIMNELNQRNAPIVYYPCFLSLWLSELILGFEKKQLEDIGIGGIFHYIYQTESKENSSMPLVLVLSKLENDVLVQNSYRTSLLNGYLIVEHLNQQHTSVFTSEVERQDLVEMGLEDNEEILAEAYKRSHALPIYYFCGFATHDPTYRGFYSVHVSSNDTKVVDWNGNVRPDFQEKIYKNLRGA